MLLNDTAGWDYQGNYWIAKQSWKIPRYLGHERNYINWEEPARSRGKGHWAKCPGSQMKEVFPEGETVHWIKYCWLVWGLKIDY